MPTMQIEAAQRAAWRREAPVRQLRQVIVTDSDFHMSDLAIIVSPIRLILTMEQLNVRGIEEGVDHI